MNTANSIPLKFFSRSQRFSEKLATALFLCGAIAFVAYFGGPNILKWYIQSGIGSCEKIPILCKAPFEELSADPLLDKTYTQQLIPHTFRNAKISIPKRFMIYNEAVKKPYYKKHKHLDKGAVIYFLREEPGFFIHLYPSLTKKGISTNFAFVKNTLQAQIGSVRDLTSAFFVVMKSIFIPDVGDQHQAVMKTFTLGTRKGIIIYNFAEKENFFDLNMVDEEDNYYKVYIKDKSKDLDLAKALSILSTIEKAAP